MCTDADTTDPRSDADGLWVALVHVVPAGPLEDEFDDASGAYVYVATPGSSPLQAQLRLTSYFTRRNWGIEGVESLERATVWLNKPHASEEVLDAIHAATASGEAVPTETWDLYFT